MMGSGRKSAQEMDLLAPATPMKPLVPEQRQIYQNGEVILTGQECYIPRFVEGRQDGVAGVLQMGSTDHFRAETGYEVNRADRWAPPYIPTTQLSGNTSNSNFVHGSVPFGCGYSTRGGGNEAPIARDMDPFTQFGHVAFCDLLAMNNGGVPGMLGADQNAMTGNSFLSDLNYQSALMFDNHITRGAGNLLTESYQTSRELQGSNQLPEQDMLKQLNERIEIQQSGSSRNRWNTYDLNALPNPEMDYPTEDRPVNTISAFPDGGSIPVIAPETPGHFKRLGNIAPGNVGIPADKQKAVVDQVSVPGGDNWLGMHETQSSTHSIAIESYNPDEEGNHDIDQIKTPQPKPRRKKHRPKVIREVKPKQTPKQREPKASDANGTPTPRKKNAGKNETSAPSTTPRPRGAEGLASSKVPKSAVKSSRKVLNFDMDYTVKESSSSHRSSRMPSSEHLPQNQEYDAYDISYRNNQILKDYMSSMAAGQANNVSTPTEATYPQYESNASIEYESRTKRDRRAPMGSNRNIAAERVHLADSFSNAGEHLRGVKRVNSSLVDTSVMERGDFSSQCTPSQVNHMYLGNVGFSGVHGMYFPEICKKRRTATVLKPNTLHTVACANTLENIRASTSSVNYPRDATRTSKYYYLNSAPGFNIIAEPRIQATTVISSHQEQTHFINWADIDKLKKKRSKVPTRVRDLDSLKGFAECRDASRSTGKKVKRTGKKDVETSRHPSSMGVLSTVSGATRTGKRQSRKRSTKGKPVISSFDIMNKHSMDLYNAQKVAGNAKGPFLALPWKDTFSVDAVIEGMEQLNINREANSVRFKDENILVPYNFQYQNQNQNALVLYKRDGTVIPFEGTQASKRRSRAKVELDEETNRVWKLLLEDINSQGIDGTDEEKAKFWDNERRVFCGRVDSFIARMRLVQGDRHFSPWKGSVVDSVVGVFLTQNVSDHLSSSAFMSVAARFPVSSEYKDEMHSKEEMSPLVEDPEICIIDLNDTNESLAWNEKSVEGPSCDRNSMTVYDADVSEEKEVVSSKESHGSTNLKDETWCCFSSSHEKPHESLLYGASSISKESEIASASGDARRIDDVTSSQLSVISSQSSHDCPNAPNARKMGSSMSLGEDLTNHSNPSSLNSSSSFVELLRLAEIPKLNASYAPIYQVPCNQSDLADHEEIKDDLKPTHKAYAIEVLDSFSIVQDKCSTVYEGCNLQGIDKVSRSLDSTRSIEDCTTEQVKSTESTLEIILHEKALEGSLKPISMVDKVCSCYVLEGEEMIIQTTKQLVGQQTDITNSQAEGSKSSPKRNQNLPTVSGETGETVVTESTCASHSSVQNEFTPTPPLSGHNNTSVLVGQQTDITNSQAERSKSSPKRNQNLPTVSGETGETVVTESTCASNSTVQNELTPTPPLSGHNDTLVETHTPLIKDTSKQNKGRTRKKAPYDWENLRKQAQVNGKSRQQTAKTMDSVDWEAVRCADVSVVADTIKERGMNNVLAERIKEFLNRILTDHGSLDLEWLRDVPPDKAKEYLLSIRGLGLKSVECVRLLTLHQLAFPVDTNVGRIAVRLGWVPLQPLPESLQLHLLELYPILESIQKYLWPRLCKLDQKTLYELHYHLITFGKVFCTKKSPNCNACPLRGECRHFASAFASARLALPGPEDRSIVPSFDSNMVHQDPRVAINPIPMPMLMSNNPMSETKSDTRRCEPIVEIPASPEAEPEQLQMSEYDIEDALDEDPNEIPTIKLNLEQFTNTLQTYIQSNMELQEGDMSNALVALATEAASIPTPKLKNVNRLRTEHHVYELPDTHRLLRGLDKREPDDPCSYLLAIWTPGETANSIEQPEKKCNSEGPGELCSDETCFYCNNQREANSQIVRGTLLIPCRTAMRGSFPLNGTYFQVNEVFADHDSSLNPIEVPREWIWNLPRRTVYFGTSIPSIFKGLSTEGIQHCFWRGYVCVRGFDQKLRTPRPLMARLHFPASKLARPRGRNTEEEA